MPQVLDMSGFLNILRYIIYATASDIFKTLDYLEHFLFWHIEVYLGIALTYLGIFVTVCDLGIFRTLAFSETCQTSTMQCFAKIFKCIRIYQLSATRY